MKKLFVLISVLIVAAACTAPPANRETVNSNFGGEKPAAPPMTQADAIAKEKAIWDTITKKDYDGFAAMLDSAQLEVTADGVQDKAASVTMVKDFEPSEVIFSDWKFLSVDKDAYVVVYNASIKGKFKGKDFPPASIHASSAWANRAGKWLAIYHQECDVMNMPPPSAGTKKAAPSSATAPAQATATSDPIANEKMIWDFLKAGQYDAFANMLATDVIEVEPNGVWDKAGIINDVKGLDFSKSTISDFKTLNIDSDAALVTYLVTNPGAKPAEEHHTTIWAMRDGKWLAVFHHGTPATHAMSSASPGMPMNAASPMTHSMTSPSPR
ncbi:MAG: nuclear transport factor 2 family protein [Blastocatellia bacterium]|nr:nuclear transport factor 2 family protein [Blastocatellia bacterium]